ncbi:MAG: hypothetical protein ACLFTZ_03270 [Acholeplasmataceae bacterium]
MRRIVFRTYIILTILFILALVFGLIAFESLTTVYVYTGIQFITIGLMNYAAWHDQRRF